MFLILGCRIACLLSHGKIQEVLASPWLVMDLGSVLFSMSSLLDEATFLFFQWVFAKSGAQSKQFSNVVYSSQCVFGHK